MLEADSGSAVEDCQNRTTIGTVTTSSLAVLTLLRRALIRLRRHAPDVLIAGSIVILGRLSVSFFLPTEVAERLTILGVFLLALLAFVLWFGFLSFTLAILVRDGHAAAVLDDFPRIFRRCLTSSIRVFWHTWILAALVGSLTLFINQAGFQPSVRLLWIIAAIITAVRGPRAVLTPVIALDHPQITTAEALARSREATTKRWPTVALLLAAIALATMAADRLLVMINLPSLMIIANLCGQAMALAAIVEVRRAVDNH